MLRLLVLGMAFVFVPTTLGQNKPSTGNDALAAAADVGKEVQSALVKANGAGLGGLRLKQAVLSLESGSSVEGGVKLNFIIFTIKHTAKKGKTTTLSLTFGSVDRLKGGGRPDLASLTDSLSRAIATAAAVATEVEVLPLSEVTVKIEFVVEKTASGGLSFKILGSDVDGSVDFDKVSKNSLEVTFAK
jgi:hypothetical protein